MKKAITIIVLFFVFNTLVPAQDHIPVPHTIPHGTSRICWGYAMGRAGGKYDGDTVCNPMTLIPDEDAISGTYFNQYDWSEIDSRPLQSGDILYWPGTHAAYVTSVPTSGGYVVVNSIGVSHMSASQWSGVISETLADAKSRVGVGNPSYFCRRKKVSITVQNSFGGGNVKVGGGTYASGSSVQVNWWEEISLEALNQNYQNVYRAWSSWQKERDNPTTENPRPTRGKSGASYTANFTSWCDITFNNSLPGASGGTISVWDTVRNAPITIRFEQTTPFNVAAIDQEINRIFYTFSQWSGGSTSTNRTLTLTATQHASYTANFNAKPLPPENVYAGGPAGSYVQVTWSEHPHPSVTQYQIWRQVKHQNTGVTDPPTLLTTVNRGTTSYTDESYVVTSGYTDDLVWYDVRSVLTLNGSTYYSDPNWVPVFAELVKLSGKPKNSSLNLSLMSAEYAVGSYPNPFNPFTTISYQLVEDADVILMVYDVMGRRVALLVEERKSAGYHSVRWNGRDDSGNTVASGVYLYRFSAVPISGKEVFRKSGKLLLAK